MHFNKWWLLPFGILTTSALILQRTEEQLAKQQQYGQEGAY